MGRTLGYKIKIQVNPWPPSEEFNLVRNFMLLDKNFKEKKTDVSGS